MYYFARSAKFFNEYGLKFYKNAYVSKGLDPPVRQIEIRMQF